MTLHGRGLICLALTGRALRPARPAPDDGPEHRGAGHRVHGQRRRRAPVRRHHRHLGQRPRRRRSTSRSIPATRPVRPPPPRPHLPAARPPGRRAPAGRPDRGERGPGAARRARARRRHLRDPERRRHHGPASRAAEIFAGSTASPSSPSRSWSPTGSGPSSWCTGWPRRGCRPSYGEFRIIGYQNDVDRAEHVALVLRRGRGPAGHAGADALEVSHRRRVRLAALRLRPAAARRHGADRAGGPRRDRVPRPGGAGHRAAQQAPRLRAAGRRAPTPCRRTSGSASRPTCATTASARRSSATSASRPSA